MDEFEAAVEQLWALAAQQRQAAEREEAKLEELNGMVQKLCAARAAGAEAVRLLGDVVAEQPYDPGAGPVGSAVLLVAALEVPGGLGVVVTDRAEHRRVARDEARPGEPHALFVPLAECPAGLKRLLVPQIRPLVARVARRLG